MSTRTRLRSADLTGMKVRSSSRVVLLGPFGPPLLTFARSCAAQGIAAYLLEVGAPSVDRNTYSSCLQGICFMRPEKLGTPEGIAEILAYAKSVCAEALVTVFDSQLLWLARNRAELEPICKLAAASAEALTFLASKRNQIELARTVGFDILPTWLLSSPRDGEGIPLGCFPLCLRPSSPADVQPTFKVRVMYSPAELNDFLEAHQCLGEPLIAQPFLHLPNLVVHGVRSETGRILAMKAFLVPRKFEGVTLSMKHFELAPDIEDSCRAFADASGITGCFHYELLFDRARNRAYFLEINARLGGTTDLAFRLGFDEPALTLAAYGLKAHQGGRYFMTSRGQVVRKRFLLKHILAACKGGLCDLDFPPVDRIRHIARSCFEMSFVSDSIFSWRDLRGSLWFYSRKPSEH